uniref:Protein sleepless n=1 Tax=Lutzomyia longipalpis TaxID=7200 RepID=A0A1B0CI31_LUTLO
MISDALLSSHEMLCGNLVFNSTLKCYLCEATRDPQCADNPQTYHVLDCEKMLGQNSENVRCLTVKNKDIILHRPYAIRTCAAAGVCNSSRRSDGSYFLRAFMLYNYFQPGYSCEECNSDYCNNY